MPVAAQRNLVPNAGFDSLAWCPDNLGQVALAEPWRIAQGTPDLFHECAVASDYRVPKPFFCQQLPARNGRAYAGITVYGTREFLEIDLEHPLKAGKPYYVRFFVAADADCQGSPKGTSDAVALMLKRSNDPTGTFATVLENSGTVIKNTVDWLKISGCYFDQLPDTVLMCGDAPVKLDATFLEASYMWSTGTTAAVLFATIFTPNADGVNDELEISVGCDYPFELQHFEIFDRWGNRVFQSSGWQANFWDGKWKGNFVLPGVYTWRLSFSTTGPEAGRIVTRHGHTTVLR